MSRDASVLDARRRAVALRAAAAADLDLVVVGAGVTGAGCALDAAARGLRVALVDAGDLAVGTSSRSGKTFHGGLRYLERLNFALVATALRERNLMMDVICPHLGKPERFLYPLTRRWERGYAGAGIALYDLMALRGRSVPRHRHLTRTGALREAPALDPTAITGAIQFSDVRVDDARHTMTLARTAAAQGAYVLPRAPVVAFAKEGDRVVGVTVRDAVTGADHDIRARAVINATGVWADRLQRLAGAETFAVRPAKGVHLVVPGDRIDSRTGILARAEDSTVVARRWWDHWIIGTTDTPCSEPLENPVATAADIEYLLRNLNRLLRTDVRRSDIVGTYAGLRPLLAPAGRDVATTSALSRDHAVIPGPDAMVTIVGGKYTTYRPMAADAVDAAVRWVGRDVPGSSTARLPLVGAPGLTDAERRAIAERHRLAAAEVDRLAGRYGDRTAEVLAPARADPTLARPVAGAPGYLGAEYLYAVAAEGAMTLEDVLARRTHVSIETTDGGVAAAPAVAGLIGAWLGWDAGEQARQVRAYGAAMAAQRAALAD